MIKIYRRSSQDADNAYLNDTGQPKPTRILQLSAMLFLLLFLSVFHQSFAQVPKKVSFEPIIEPVPTDLEDMHSHVSSPHLDDHGKALLNREAIINNQTATFDVTFGPGALANPEALAAFQFALDIWASEVVSSVPIRVSAEFANLGPGVLASAGPTHLLRDFAGAPVANAFYPAALADALAGVDLDPSEEFDLVVNLGNGIPWYFGLDGNTPAGQFNFVTIALHELCHGLGFLGVSNVTGGQGTVRFAGFPSIYSLFVENENGEIITTFPDPSVELGNQLTGGNLFANGELTVAAFAGNLPELFAPNPYQGGSSYSHWDEAGFPAGNSNALMTPAIGPAESNFNVGELTRAYMKDMGWTFNDAAAPAFNATPTSLAVELFVDSTATETINLASSGVFSSTTFTVSVDEEATWLTVAPATGLLNAGESVDLTATFDATGLPKGDYPGIITILSDSTETPTTVEVLLTVFDGTEAAIIEVNPESLSETLTQGDISVQTLEISNLGDAELNFDISIDNVTGGTLERNITESNNAIANDGFKLRRFKSGKGIGALVLPSAARLNTTASTLYATDFESFLPGELNGQEGWLSQFDGNFVISDQNAANGSQHLRSVSDGLGGTRPAAVLALSPVVSGATDPITVANADISIQGSGVTWEIIPQSPTAESVITRLRFNADGTIDALTSTAGAFVPVNATIPSGYFNVRITADASDNSFRILFDGVEVFADIGFAAQIEQLVVLTGMEATGSTFDMDNVDITDGDGESLFISATPISGTLNPGETTQVAVRFDARGLETGVFTADLTVASNDVENPTVVVPATLTVVTPPSISVDPESLVAAVDVQVDDPAIATDTLTISNSGDSPLDFTTALGSTTVNALSRTNIPIFETPDLTNYGLGNPPNLKEKSTPATVNHVLASREGSQGSGQIANNTFSDSIFFDTGLDFPSDFAGVQTAAYTTGMRFEVTQPSFTLTAVRNAYQTEAVTNPVIIMEIYQGGAGPTDGTLLLSQNITQEAATGVFLLTELNTALSFAQGDVFWIVHRYPDGIAFPQGVDDVATQQPNTYFFSGDGGTTFNPSGFVFLTRALSGGGGSDSYLTLEPSTGTVNPGESVELLVSFDGETLGNGVYNTDIVISSNDPENPTVNVPTEFTVSGQVAEIAVSDQFLLFNSVFVGADKDLQFTIFNEGLGQLDVSSIAVDNADFTLDASSASIGANDSLVVTVTYAPSAIGNSNGIITITSSDEDEPLSFVIVAGVGTDPPVITLVPSEVIDTTNAGTTLASSIDIRNDGNFPLIYSLPEFAAANALADPSFVPNNTTKIEFGAFGTEKSSPDKRIGFPVVNSVGTDLGFGYTWIDSDEAGGPIYNFTDISATGTNITGIVGADGSTEVALPFVFEFYGNPQGSVWINANGFVSFEEPSGLTFVNDQIPDPTGTNNLIAGLWDDLEPQNFDGSVTYEAFADRFIIQWSNASVFFGADDEEVTFQIVLMDNGNIDIFYEDVESAPFLTSATVGIENGDGTDGAQVAFNAPYIKDNLALRFIKPAIALTQFISDATPLSGVVPAGGQVTIGVTLDATNLNDGQYFDELCVSSNDPVTPDAKGLFNLTVIGFPEIAVDQDTISFDPLFIGLSSQQTLTVSNVGTKTLEISGISSFNADFTLSEAGPLSLLPGGSATVDVTFAPSTAGQINDLITILSDDAFGNDFQTVALTGIGVEPPVVGADPDSIQAEVFETESVSGTLTISNTGGTPLNYILNTPTFGTATALATAGQYEYIEYPEILDKETADTRVGPPMINASGGPGTFGYSWVDSNSGGLPFDFTDISTTGTLANTGQDGNELVALPFTFSFFGVDNNQVYIGANGFVSFSEPVGTNFTNSQIPTTGGLDNMVAGLWDDIEPVDGGGIFYQTIGNQFIVQWQETPGFGFFTAPPAPVTFQIILFDDGTIKLQYSNVQSTIATSSTVGVEGPGGVDGLQIIFNTAFLEDELAITITPPILGSIAPGDTDEIAYTLDAADLLPGTYNDNFTITSNDPITPTLTVPVELEVLNLPDVITFSLIDADRDEVISQLSDGDVINLDNYPINDFNIVANTNPETVGSVIFEFNGETSRENVLPYALAGDRSNGTDFRSLALPLGESTLTATAFTQRNGNGKSGTPLSITFTVIRNNEGSCYGEEIISYNPGLRKNGNDLPAIRSNADNALGVPNENDTYNFASLGFGGSIEIRLGCEIEDQPGNDLIVVETSFRDAGTNCEAYPETARVEASQDGITWVTLAEEICRDGEVDLAAGGLASAQFFRITDTSNPADFSSGNADGYDVDGIASISGSSADTTGAVTAREQFNSQANIVANEDAIISAFPNPVENQLSLSLDNEEDEVVTVNIYSFSGALVYSNTIPVAAGVDSESIDISKLQKGIYQLTMRDSDANIKSTIKILKK